MRKRIRLECGAVVGRYRHGDGERIVALLTLPSTEWDELTTHLKDYDRESYSNPELHDTSLEDRIEVFVDYQVLCWRADIFVGTKGFDSELDDDVPF